MSEFTVEQALQTTEANFLSKEHKGEKIEAAMLHMGACVDVLYDALKEDTYVMVASTTLNKDEKTRPFGMTLNLIGMGVLVQNDFEMVLTLADKSSEKIDGVLRFSGEYQEGKGHIVDNWRFKGVSTTLEQAMGHLGYMALNIHDQVKNK